MYAKVPAIDGIPQVGTRFLHLGVGISDNEAVVHVEGDALDPGWVEMTEEEYRQYVPESEHAPQPEPADQKLARLEQQNLILMGAIADLYEEILLKEESE